MKVAVLGLGTVGTGVLNVFSLNQQKIMRLAGEEIDITHVLVNEVDKARDADLSGINVTGNIDDILDADIDIVIEVMGGILTTRDILIKFLQKGVHVISANKDMLAEHIDELVRVANDNDARLSYEASVAGGVPIIRTIETSLNANDISKVMGILNGTTNYILSKMTIDGWDYDTALSKAQELGYAEADPTNDVEGIDAKRKIVLLSRLAFNRKVAIDDVETRGISGVDVADLKCAKDAGYIMKLLGKGERCGDEFRVSVEPLFLPGAHQLSGVDYEKNAVYVLGNAVGETMYYGPGAGSQETASAIVSDLMNVITDGRGPNFAPEEQAELTAIQETAVYYCRVSDDEAKVKAHFNDDVRILAAGNGTTFITPALTAKAVGEFEDILDVITKYQVIGAD